MVPWPLYLTASLFPTKVGKLGGAKLNTEACSIRKKTPLESKTKVMVALYNIDVARHPLEKRRRT